MNSNVIQMPVEKKTSTRELAANILKAYYGRKRQKDAEAEEAGRLSQSQIDGRAEGWQNESDSTNARLAKIHHVSPRFCDLYGHRWALMNCYGKTYMECEVCKAVRPVTAKDLEEAERLGVKG